MPLEVLAYLPVVSEVLVDPRAWFMTLAMPESIKRGSSTESGSRNINSDSL